MPIYQDPNSPITCVMIKGATIVWDGVTRPEENDGGNMRWNLKVVLPPNHPDIAILNQLAQTELQASEFKGILPQGGIMPEGTASPAEFNGLYPGWSVVNCSTFKTPQVYDETGQILDPMVYGGQIFSGQCVNVLVHCKAYNNKSRGVAARMDGFSIIASKGAQPTSLGGGGVDTASAFGGGQPAGQQQAPAGQQPQQQQGGFHQPPAGQQPQQATDFLPAGPGAPAGPGGPAAAPEPKYNDGSGAWTRAQLLSAGYQDAQISAMPQVP